MNKLNLIDADAFCYICSKDTLEESIESVDSLLKNILYHTNSHYFYLCFSSKPYFRNKVCDLYKSKRQASSLKYIKEIKEYLLNKYKCIETKELEADDLVCILLNLFKEHKDFAPMISSTDKDVLKTIAGTHFDYKNFKSVTTTENEAVLYEAKQVLIGDSTDTILGIVGYGEKAFLKETIRIDNVLEDVLSIYIREYRKKGKSEYLAIHDFTKNYKLVHLLRNIEEVNTAGVFPETVTLPQPNFNS
jgi:5'-3' exonuclease